VKRDVAIAEPNQRRMNLTKLIINRRSRRQKGSRPRGFAHFLCILWSGPLESLAILFIEVGFKSVSPGSAQREKQMHL
jgi:hypothetical protein